MQNSLELPEQHRRLQQEILGLIEDTIAARILRWAGTWIQRVTRQSRPIPWYVSALLLEVAAILPQTLIALVLRDPHQVIGEGLIWSVAAVLVTVATPLCDWSASYILLRIRDHIIPAMKDDNDLDRLKLFLIQLSDWRQPLIWAFLVSLIWTIIAIPIFNSANNVPIRISYVFDIWLFGFLGLGIGVHYLTWFMRLPSQLKHYQYELYQLDPSRSEIIAHISNLSTPSFLATAIYLAVVTMVASLFEFFNWVIPVIIVSFWIPLIVNFINSQSAINQIIESGKWQTLNEIKERIHALKNGSGLNSTAEIETLNKLMELYERVHNARNTRLRITSIVEFLNQLLLPLLAFLLSNYNAVLKLFNLNP